MSGRACDLPGPGDPISTVSRCEYELELAYIAYGIVRHCSVDVKLTFKLSKANVTKISLLHYIMQL